MYVREAGPGELPAVMNVLDAGALEIAVERVRVGLEDGRVLVIADDDRILGALVLEIADDPAAAEIEAVAVRRARRAQGLGTALVWAALDRSDRLVAAFDESVRPFWQSLGFEIETGARPGRFVGRLGNEPAE